ncbi:MAG: gfo/Idh/MocA family oxidoreductase, partial [candidate division FCPU426 bacterium]
GEQGFKDILVTEASHPYAGAWWPSGHIIGYEHTFVHEVYELMGCLATGKMPSPNFEDGVRCQEVLEAVERSAKSRRWVKISSV